MVEGLQLFTMGAWVIVLAYLTSAIGVFVGVTSVRKVRTAVSNRARNFWLVMACFVIGGVGVWLAQFLPMAGFAVEGSVVRYDLVTIMFSMLLALVAVFVALVVATPSDGGPPKTAPAALILGVGLAAVPYAIMWSVRTQGEVSFNPAFVAAAVFFAFVTAAGFMWQVQQADTWPKRFVGGALVGAAVMVVHFLAAASIQVTPEPTTPAPSGIEVFSILFPLFVAGLVLLVVPIVAVLLAPDRVAATLEREVDEWNAESFRSPSR